MEHQVAMTLSDPHKSGRHCAISQRYIIHSFKLSETQAMPQARIDARAVNASRMKCTRRST
jgi:hypothetical protein